MDGKLTQTISRKKKIYSKAPRSSCNSSCLKNRNIEPVTKSDIANTTNGKELSDVEDLEKTSSLERSDTVTDRQTENSSTGTSVEGDDWTSLLPIWIRNIMDTLTTTYQMVSESELVHWNLIVDAGILSIRVSIWLTILTLLVPRSTLSLTAFSVIFVWLLLNLDIVVNNNCVRDICQYLSLCVDDEEAVEYVNTSTQLSDMHLIIHENVDECSDSEVLIPTNKNSLENLKDENLTPKTVPNREVREEEKMSDEISQSSQPSLSSTTRLRKGKKFPVSDSLYIRRDFPWDKLVRVDDTVPTTSSYTQSHIENTSIDGIVPKSLLTQNNLSDFDVKFQEQNDVKCSAPSINPAIQSNTQQSICNESIIKPENEDWEMSSEELMDDEDIKKIDFQNLNNPNDGNEPPYYDIHQRNTASNQLSLCGNKCNSKNQLKRKRNDEEFMTSSKFRRKYNEEEHFVHLANVHNSNDRASETEESDEETIWNDLGNYRQKTGNIKRRRSTSDLRKPLSGSTKRTKSSCAILQPTDQKKE
ncbi:hypothetical protein SNEBB_009832 [Seison nebaliae]|nr:hypothetical protein SNEBB_009832 [Seison nebaliae]